jgi:hypothetical protein
LKGTGFSPYFRFNLKWLQPLRAAEAEGKMPSGAKALDIASSMYDLKVVPFTEVRFPQPVPLAESY